VAFILLGLRVGLGAVFLTAGLAKLLQPAAFAEAVAGYRLLPDRLVGVVARTLPALEVAAGATLAAGWLRAPTALLLAGLLVAFAAAMAINLLRGRSIDCGCHGPTGPQPISWPLIARNLGLALAALAVASWPATVQSGGAAAVGAVAVVLLLGVRLAAAAGRLVRASAAAASTLGGKRS
jgi:hypothetical protein